MVRLSSKALKAVSPFSKPKNIHNLKPVPQVAVDGSNQKLKLSDYFKSKEVDGQHSYDVVYGAPTIYNHEKSSHNPHGVIKAMRKHPSGVFYAPAEASTYGLTFSEVIPKSFLLENDIIKPLYESLPHNIEDKLRYNAEFQHGPVLKGEADLIKDSSSIPSDLSKLSLTKEKLTKVDILLNKGASYADIAEKVQLPVFIIKYIDSTIETRAMKLDDHATYKDDEIMMTKLFKKHHAKHV